MNSKDTDLSNKVLKAALIHEIEVSNQTIKFITSSIKMYQETIYNIKNDMPLFLSKKKKYSTIIETYKLKLLELYNELDNEFELVYKIQKQLKEMEEA